ncbi:universal stress protein [Sediminicoccus sp. BL-A-41-H5]|uniref:universal stress protein n=1 Tax=Sediminicoccus sp. BL-A-41-H5 TaxID=3421106 RepID=UPI003D66B056
MPIKDILVHLDASPASGPRLDFAMGLAKRHQAHLIGLFIIDIVPPFSAGADMGGGSAMAELLMQMREDALTEAASGEAAFRDLLRREGQAGEWRQAEGMTSALLAVHGRYVDLIVVGQPEPKASSMAVEAALFSTGRPILLVPYTGPAKSLCRRVLIAWNGSREAARAVNDALPILAGAESVTLLVVDPKTGPSDHGEEPGADIALHLARHGVGVTVRRVMGDDVGVGDMLLNEVADLSSDLIIMGGYGHSRLRELVLGGATRTLLRQMTVPVLMSH